HGRRHVGVHDHRRPHSRRRRHHRRLLRTRIAAWSRGARRRHDGALWTAALDGAEPLGTWRRAAVFAENMVARSAGSASELAGWAGRAGLAGRAGGAGPAGQVTWEGNMGRMGSRVRPVGDRVVATVLVIDHAERP